MVEFRRHLTLVSLAIACNFISQLKWCCEASERQRLHVSEYSEAGTNGNTFYLTYQDASELLTWDGQEELLQGVSIASSTVSVSMAAQIESETGTVSLQASSPSQDMSLNKSPFIICNVNGSETGYNRRTEVCSWLNISEAVCVAAPILSNTINKTCSIFQTSTAAIEYAAVKSKNIVSLPLDPGLKMRQGLLDAITKYNATQFYVDLCDTNSTSERVYKTLTNQLLNNGTSLSKRSLLSTLFNKKVQLDGSATPPRHLRSGKSDNHGFSKRMSVFERSLEVLNSNECSAVYRGLNMTSNGSSSFTIKISIANVSDSNFISLCTLNVVQLLAADNGVCSINYVRSIGLSATAEGSIGSNNINWIVQSDTRSFRPWFQAGLTGVGQVIGLSDSVRLCDHDINLESDFVPNTLPLLFSIF